MQPAAHHQMYEIELDGSHRLLETVEMPCRNRMIGK
jgi:hypothetical protein